MNCDKCRELLSEYIDGRLDDVTAAALSAHLEECADCRRLDEELRATVAALGGLETKTPPIDFSQSVTARLERRMLLDAPLEIEKPRRRLKPLPIAGFGLAAAAAILAALYIWFAPSQKQAAPATPPSARTADELQPSMAPPANQPEVGKPVDKRARRADDKPIAGAWNVEQAHGTVPAAGGAAPGVAGNVTTSAVPPAAQPVASSSVENNLAYAKRDTLSRKDAEQLRALGYLGAGGGPAEPAGSRASSAPAAPAVGFEFKAQPAPAAVVDSAGAAGKQELAAFRRADAPATTSTTEVGAKLKLEAAAAEKAAPTHGVTIAKAASAPQSFDIVSSESAVTMAYELVKLLPSEKGTPLPEGALTVDMLRYAAFKRGAVVEEASDDKTVMQVALDPAAIESVHAALLAKASPKLGDTESGLAGDSASLNERAAQAPAPAAPAQPAPADLARSFSDKKAVVDAAYTVSPVKVRFVFERKPAPAPSK